MRILLVTLYYAPDLGPSAPMLSMLSEDLAQRGHAMTVLSAVPHFPSGRVEERYRRGVWQWSVENGVRICRVRVPSGNRASLRHRLLTFIVYQCLSTLAGLRLKYDVVLITNPAIETFLPFTILAWLRRKAAIFCVWDLYPEVGVQLGIFRNPFVTGVVKALEDFCLRRALWVQALGEGFIPNLQPRAASADRVVWIPPWLDTDFIQPMPRRNVYSHENSLDDAFVVLYAGNLGFSQGLECVLITARQLAADPSIRFVLVGDGPARAGLVAQAAETGLSNVTFLPFQPRERLPEVLATADLALVSLLSGVGGGSLPSKTYTYLASGRAILAITDEGSELWRLIEGSQGGRCIQPGKPDLLAAAVLECKRNPKMLGEMGANGRQYVVAHHSRQCACVKFEMLLSSALEKKTT
jgi:colanic acid biosynthesis glycosyl transferase WcaI